MVSGLIGFVSEGSRGSMSMTLNTAFLNLLSETLFGENPEKDDTTKLNYDIAGELCNQVLGRVKSNFATIGLKIKVGLPDLIVGENHFIIHRVSGQILTIPVTVDDARCVIECCMEKISGSSSSDLEAI